MDKMLLQYVFPEFNSPHGHMRARVNKTIIRNIILYIYIYIYIYITSILRNNDKMRKIFNAVTIVNSAFRPAG